MRTTPLPAEEPPMLAGSGWDAGLLEQVRDLNERMLARLQCAAGAIAPPRSPLQQAWLDLDAAMQRRLAACPYLLLDVGFAGAALWQPSAPRVGDAGASGGYFADGDGLALVRCTLLLGWHLARANPLGARLMLGMSGAALGRIAGCRLRDLEALAGPATAWAVPRWERQPTVWRQLIEAARHGSSLTLHLAQLRGLQLLAGASVIG